MASVFVGVIDEGIQSGHPDLSGLIWINPYDPADGLDNDGVGDNNDTTASYPANDNTTSSAGYDSVIAVAAITSSEAKASYSNYGASTVEIGAPGSGITSITAYNTYSSFSGTSMAAPHGTGAAAMYASSHPGATAQDIRSAILGSAVPTASLSGKTITGGRLNVSGF